MNKEKVKQTEKFNKTNIQLKRNKQYFFSWWSSNINVQESNSYKINLKVLKYKWTLHFHCMYW